MPCGLLYGALAGAAAAGSALAGALAMLAFAAGTAPALMGVALLGRFFGRRHGGALRVVSACALLLNSGVLTALALRSAGLV
jgi:sulfite exporter TauE/SafE